MSTKKQLVASLVEEAMHELYFHGEVDPHKDTVRAFASECAENILNELDTFPHEEEIGHGYLHTATLANGQSWKSHNCIEHECECDCHDDKPLPTGVHVTIQLDNSPRVGLGRVVLLKEKEL